MAGAPSGKKVLVQRATWNELRPRQHGQAVPGLRRALCVLPGPGPAELTRCDMTGRWSGPRVRTGVVNLLVIALVATAGPGVWNKRVPGMAAAETAAPLRKVAEFELPGPA